jgi:hypothetical protein
VDDNSVTLCHNHLRNSHAARDGESFGAQISQNHANLAPVIGIDGAGAVEASNAVFER